MARDYLTEPFDPERDVKPVCLYCEVTIQDGIPTHQLFCPGGNWVKVKHAWVVGGKVYCSVECARYRKARKYHFVPVGKLCANCGQDF